MCWPRQERTGAVALAAQPRGCDGAPWFNCCMQFLYDLFGYTGHCSFQHGGRLENMFTNGRSVGGGRAPRRARAAALRAAPRPPPRALRPPPAPRDARPGLDHGRARRGRGRGRRPARRAGQGGARGAGRRRVGRGGVGRAGPLAHVGAHDDQLPVPQRRLVGGGARRALEGGRNRPPLPGPALRAAAGAAHALRRRGREHGRAHPARRLRAERRAAPVCAAGESRRAERARLALGPRSRRLAPRSAAGRALRRGRRVAHRVDARRHGQDDAAGRGRGGAGDAARARAAEWAQHSLGGLARRRRHLVRRQLPVVVRPPAPAAPLSLSLRRAAHLLLALPRCPSALTSGSRTTSSTRPSRPSTRRPRARSSRASCGSPPSASAPSR